MITDTNDMTDAEISQDEVASKFKEFALYLKEKNVPFLMLVEREKNMCFANQGSMGDQLNLMKRLFVTWASNEQCRTVMAAIPELIGTILKVTADDTVQNTLVKMFRNFMNENEESSQGVKSDSPEKGNG